MRVRILKPLTGVIEGRALSQFHTGFIYDVPEFLGGQMVALRTAIEVRSTDPAVAIMDVDMEHLSGGVLVIPADTAQDRPEKRRKKRR